MNGRSSRDQVVDLFSAQVVRDVSCLSLLLGRSPFESLDFPIQKENTHWKAVQTSNSLNAEKFRRVCEVAECHLWPDIGYDSFSFVKVPISLRVSRRKIVAEIHRNPLRTP